MNAKRWGLLCALIACSIGFYWSHAVAQAPESGSKESKPESGPAEICQCVDQSDSAAVARIEEVLAAPLNSPGLDYTDQPLQDVLSQIQQDYGIPVQLDRNALEAAGIGTDVPVTISLHNISLKSALRLMLKRFDMRFFIQDEVLEITTKEAADRHLVTCVYNLEGIVSVTDPDSAGSLVEAIEACVATDTWCENGNGKADAVLVDPGLLMVSQTPAVQEEVKAVLLKIRAIREHAPIPKPRPKSPTPATKPSPAATPEQKPEQNKKPAAPKSTKPPVTGENPFG